MPHRSDIRRVPCHATPCQPSGPSQFVVLPAHPIFTLHVGHPSAALSGLVLFSSVSFDESHSFRGRETCSLLFFFPPFFPTLASAVVEVEGWGEYLQPARATQCSKHKHISGLLVPDWRSFRFPFPTHEPRPAASQTVMKGGKGKAEGAEI